MSNVTIWHNPRCSKSRQTLALLEENGVTPTQKLYLKDAPTKAEISSVLVALGGVKASQIIRKGESTFKQLGLSLDNGDDVLISAMAANPILIERPIVFVGDKARIGRPPESVLELL